MKVKSALVAMALITLGGCSAPATSSTAGTTPSATAAASASATAAASATAGAAATTGAPVTVTGQPATLAGTGGYFRIQTQFLAGEDKCLESNREAAESVLQGATFQDTCQDVTGQQWKITPAKEAGYYTLQTKFLEAQNKCLEGNRTAPDSTLNGAAFMDTCQDVTGQQWKFVDAGNGYYRMQTKFLEAQNKCFEGNRLADESVLKGASFLDTCQEVTGQLWKLTPLA